MDSVSILVFLSSLWVCIHLLKQRKSSSGKLPPGPFPFPVIGNLFHLGKQPHKTLSELAKIYGPLMTLKLGRSTIMVVSSSAMAKEVLQKNDQAFSGRIARDAFQVFNHHKFSIVILPANSEWRTLRKICNTHMFTPRMLDNNQGLRRQKVQELLSHINNCSKNGEPVDIGRAAFTTTLNLISNTLFSIDLAHHTSQSSQEFKEIVTGMMESAGKFNIVDFFPVLWPFDPQGVRRGMKMHVGKVYELFDGIIDQRLRSRKLLNSSTTSTSHDLLDVLLDQSEQNPSEFGRKHIKALLLDLFIAGSDTTSITVEWAMAELLCKPETMAKARLEIEEIVGKYKFVEESDIVKLPYLNAIMKETLRLHPSVPLLITHKAESDVEICGFTVPNNTQVRINAWAIGRDPSIWLNPNSFMPERFLDSEMDFKGRDFEFIPFGAGRRICPGLPFASRMVPLMLASLLQSFNWMLENGIKPKDLNMDEKFGVTLHKAESLRAIPLKV